MPNTLTEIIPSIYAGLDVVSREMIGIIPAVSTDATVERAAVGQVVTVPVAPPATGGDVVAGVDPADDGDQVIGSVPLTISKSKYSPVRWNGEEQLMVGPTGQYNKILADQFAQSFRWLTNQIEVDLMRVAYLSGSRAYGTAGTTPFGVADDVTDFSGLNRILDDNGAPQYGRQLVVGSAARENLESKQKIFIKTNEAGTDGLLRNRVLNRGFGFDLGYSHAAQAHVKGTGAGYLSDAAFVVGDKALTVDTGAGTVINGDVVTFAGDTNKYIVGVDLAAGALTLNDNGLRETLADNSALTVGNNYTANVAFTPNALILASRAPAVPIINGKPMDKAEDRTFVTDPISGLMFEISMYLQYKQVRYEVAIAWGANPVKREHIVVLMG